MNTGKKGNLILNVAAIVFAVAGALMTSGYRWICFGLALAAVVAGTALSYRNAPRCPHCGRVLAGQGSSLTKCPYCYGSLQSDEDAPEENAPDEDAPDKA